MLANWKTTLTGVLALVIVAWNAYTTKTINVDEIVAALVGIGLVQAKDWNVTGGNKSQ